MNKFSVIISVLICSLFLSCTKEDKLTGCDYSKSYLNGYLNPKAITIENQFISSAYSDSDSLITVLTLRGDLISNTEESFEELAKFYKDDSFNRYILPGWRTAVNDSIEKVTVTTLSDFDASHPKGSVVTDLMECEYVSFNDFIQSGYDHKAINYSSEDYHGYLAKYFGFDGPNLKRDGLNNLGYQNTKLIAPELTLNFKKLPEKKGNYQFEMTIFFKENKITTTFNYTFP